jgi:hypothetical protein
MQTGLSADQLYGGAAGTEYAADYASGSFAEYIDRLAAGSSIPDFAAESFPAAAPPDPVLPRPVLPDPVLPDTVFPDPVLPDTVFPDPVLPDTVFPDPVLPDTVPPEEPGLTPGTGFPAMFSAPPPAPADAPPQPGRGYPDWPDDIGQPADPGPAEPPAGHGWYDDGPATRPGALLSPDPLDELRYRRPTRARLLAGLAAVAILGITGITGTLVVMHSHDTARQAGAGSSGQPSSATPAQTGAATQAVAQWTTPVAIDPQTLASRTAITGLSCTRRGGCYAADSAGTVLALHSAGDWPVAATDANGGLVALSCPTARSCLAIDSQGLSMVLSHGTWSSPAPIGTGSGTVTSASCTSSDFCLAVDTIGQAFTYAGPSGGWSQRTIVPSGQALNSVSCASRTDCVAVGAGGGVYRFNGVSWTGPATVDSGHDLISVSCPSTGFCMAVDSAGDAVQFSSGHWAAQRLGFTAAAVSCPAVGTCLAVGGAGVATYGGDNWTAPSAVDAAGLGRIDCVAVNSCVATDQSANVLFYSASAK